jgi:hypothetical protein
MTLGNGVLLLGVQLYHTDWGFRHGLIVCEIIKSTITNTLIA